MRKLTKKTAVIVAGSTLLVAVGGGVAFAYWTSSGSGSGSAATSSGGNTLSVTQTGAPSDLAPGVAPEALTGSISNSAANPVHVNSLTVTITSVTNAGAAGCTVADYGLTTGTTALTKGPTTAPQTLTVTVNQDVVSGSPISIPAVNIGFANDQSASQDGCKGATPQLSYSAS
ncbi:MAG TPA: hypothetical protein VGN81_15070 [Pseudonocardiaceae bacterium]|jgi:hypothetical protein